MGDQFVSDDDCTRRRACTLVLSCSNNKIAKLYVPYCCYSSTVSFGRSGSWDKTLCVRSFFSSLMSYEY